MSGLRLEISRPLPPPPYGFAYLLDGAGRILTGQNGELLVVSSTGEVSPSQDGLFLISSLSEMGGLVIDDEQEIAASPGLAAEDAVADDLNLTGGDLSVPFDISSQDET